MKRAKEKDGTWISQSCVQDMKEKQSENEESWVSQETQLPFQVLEECQGQKLWASLTGPRQGAITQCFSVLDPREDKCDRFGWRDRDIRMKSREE